MRLFLLLLSLLAAFQVANSRSNWTGNRQCSNSSDVCELNKKILRNLCKLLMICKDPQSACKKLEKECEHGTSSSGDSEVSCCDEENASENGAEQASMSGEGATEQNNGASSVGGSGRKTEEGSVGGVEEGVVQAQETDDQKRQDGGISEGNGDEAEGTIEEGLVQAQEVHTRPAGNNRTRPAGGTNSSSSGSQSSSNSTSSGFSSTSSNSTSSNTTSNPLCSCSCQQPIQLHLECNSTCCPCQSLIPIQITVNNRTNSSFTLLLTYSNPSPRSCPCMINACLNCGSTCLANVSNTNNQSRPNSTLNAQNSSSNSTLNTTDACGTCGPRCRGPCSPNGRSPICSWNNRPQRNGSPRRPYSYRNFCAYDVNLSRAVKPFSNMNQNNMTMNQKHYCPEETPVILDDDCW